MSHLIAYPWLGLTSPPTSRVAGYQPEDSGLERSVDATAIPHVLPLVIERYELTKQTDAAVHPDVLPKCIQISYYSTSYNFERSLKSIIPWSVIATGSQSCFLLPSLRGSEALRLGRVRASDCPQSTHLNQRFELRHWLGAQRKPRLDCIVLVVAMGS